MIFLPEEAKKVLDEAYEQRLRRPVKAVELPCKDHHDWKVPVIVQISRTGDHLITCPKCGRQHHLVWSSLQDNIRFA